MMAVFCTAATARAATLTVITDLSFGSFGLMDNSTPQTIIVTPASGVTYGIKVVDGPTPPEAGEYLLEGLTPDTLLDVSIDDMALSPGGGGSPDFAIGSFTTNTPTTDSSGNATLLVGATLTTSGTGVHYESDQYSGTMNITIIF